jgi:hypothetical protein
MPQRKKPAIRFRNKGATPLAPGGGDRTDLRRVALELAQVSVEAMGRSGLSTKEQEDAFLGAMRQKRSPGRTAKMLLERSHAIGDMLSYWQKNERYVDQHGEPRVLPVRGKGTTLETLARRFVPDMRVSEVVTAIVRHGEVQRLKGNKVALLGTIMLLTPKTPELTLAAVTLGVQRLAGTILHNNALPEGEKHRGHFQRYASGELTEREFREWLKRVPPELQKSAAGAESTLRLADSKRRKGKSSGVGIFIFRDE